LFMDAEETREWMAQLGFRSSNEMIGRCDALEQNDDIKHWKAGGIDLSRLLMMPHDPATQQEQVYNTEKQEHELGNALDYRLIEQAGAALERWEAVTINSDVCNTDRVVGTIL